jgi:hypothetical protein
MTSKASAVLATAAAIVSLAACAAKSPTPAPAAASATPAVVAAQSTSETNGAIERHTELTIKAKVVDVDHDKRHVTLRGPNGNTETYAVDESVKNFPQVKKGDEVVAKYYQAIAVRVKKPGEAEPGITEAGGLATAEPGAKPGAVEARTVTITATVKKVDHTHQTVTLKGPRGRVVDVEVQNPANLDKVKKGDLVEITYTEALAISVEKAPKHSKHASQSTH